MKIKTEFKVGDTVYVVADDEIRRVEVQKVKVRAEENENGEFLSVNVYVSSPDVCTTIRDEAVAGRTPQKLLDKLLVQFKKDEAGRKQANVENERVIGVRNEN